MVEQQLLQQAIYEKENQTSKVQEQQQDADCGTTSPGVFRHEKLPH